MTSVLKTSNILIETSDSQWLKKAREWREIYNAFQEIKATEEEIIEFCRGNLAHFKCPTKIIFKELLKTSTGKIQKFILRAEVEGI